MRILKNPPLVCLQMHYYQFHKVIKLYLSSNVTRLDFLDTL